MTTIADLTDPAAVYAALLEFDHLGRQAFLVKHGFEESRDFFLQSRSLLYDTKPIVAAALAHQYPSAAALRPDQFSGGSDGAVKTLMRLGFTVVTRAQIRPPQLGQDYASRTEICAAYGGDKIGGIARFPGDEVVNVFSDARGPYSDELPSLVDDFGYRGQGLNGDHQVNARGNALLEEARIQGRAARFWYRPRHGKFTFMTWVVVAGRAWIRVPDTGGGSHAEIDWRLQAVPTPNPIDWAISVQAITENADVYAADAAARESAHLVGYAGLVAFVESRIRDAPKVTLQRIDYQRSAIARSAVLLRANGNCESPRCTGMPSEPNRRGEPILDVDHILDLALGGADHPSNMAALCPNCHAVKTRGKRSDQWRSQLLKVASRAHANAIKSSTTAGA